MTAGVRSAFIRAWNGWDVEFLVLPLFIAALLIYLAVTSASIAPAPGQLSDFLGELARFVGLTTSIGITAATLVYQRIDKIAEELRKAKPGTLELLTNDNLGRFRNGYAQLRAELDKVTGVPGEIDRTRGRAVAIDLRDVALLYNDLEDEAFKRDEERRKTADALERARHAGIPARLVWTEGRRADTGLPVITFYRKLDRLFVQRSIAGKETGLVGLTDPVRRHLVAQDIPDTLLDVESLKRFGPRVFVYLGLGLAVSLLLTIVRYFATGLEIVTGLLAAFAIALLCAAVLRLIRIIQSPTQGRGSLL